MFIVVDRVAYLKSSILLKFVLQVIWAADVSIDCIQYPTATVETVETLI